MTDRSKRGIRSTGMRARLAIAAAVIAGGGAAGVVAVSAGHGPAATARPAAFTAGYQHTIGEPRALTAAFAELAAQPTSALVTLAEMAPVRTFAEVRDHGVTLAAQRGVVVLATRKFLVVRSANGALHLWWLSRDTTVRDVDATFSGMAAMTGSNTAASAAMTAGNLTPAATVMTGSVSAVTQLTSATARPTTVTIDTGGQVITITIASASATVTQPAAMTSAGTMSGTATGMTRNTQPAFRSAMGVRRGDLIFVAGTRVHGSLQARVVLFAPPSFSRPAASATPAPSTTVTPGVTPAPSSSATFSGTNS